MSLVLACPKCGVGIEITDEVQAEATKAGVPLAVKHDVCPRDRFVKPQFRYVIEVYRAKPVGDGEYGDEEKVASVGTSVEAASFTEAFPLITKQINTQWEKISQMARVIDADL